MIDALAALAGRRRRAPRRLPRDARGVLVLAPRAASSSSTRPSTLFWRDPTLLEKLVRARCCRRCDGRAPASTRRPRSPRASPRRCCRPRAGRAARGRRRRAAARRGVHLLAARGAAARGLRQMTPAELAAGASAMLARLRLPLPRMPRARRAPADARLARRPARDAARARPARRASSRLLALARARAPHAAAGRAVRHLRLDGPLRADAAALPARDHQRPRTACTCCCSARGSPTSRGTCAHRDVDVALARVRRRGAPTGPAARASARACANSTGAGRAACSARTPSCC